MNIDKEVMKSIRSAIGESLKTAGKELGVNLSLGNGSYSMDGLNATFKLEVSAVQKGEVITKELADLRRFYPDLENREIQIMGEKLKVVGFKSRARKNPLLVKSVGSGKIYVCPMSAATVVH